ncbi:MAG TPA: proline iminopeptidase-family hydrolase [Steroidobacteraceae bacterium]|nr:proline iminopeptidase-family hydrolase [Steroidobacteraceae bacterium]
MTIDRRSLLLAAAGGTLAACGRTSSTGTTATPAATTAPSELPVDTGMADVPGGKVWWMRVGRDTGKTPLLTLHGGPGAAHNYLLPLKALADERQVIFFDQLGCGRSEAPEDASLYVLPRCVEELAAVRKALKLEKVILYGHSYGGVLAIEYLTQTPGVSVEKIILASTAASMPQTVAGMHRLIEALPNGRRVFELEKAGKQQSEEYQKLVELFYNTYVCRLNPWPKDAMDSIEALGKSRSYPVMNGPNEFTIVGNLAKWDRIAELDKISAPTLLLTSQYDEAPMECQQTMQAGIKGSNIVVLGNCSHLAMQEKPEEYLRALRSFMA